MSQSTAGTLQLEPADPVATDAASYWGLDRPDVHGMSHWLGHGAFSEDRWLGTGAEHVRLFEQLCTRAAVEPAAVETVVEWGPGGGANATAFCTRVRRYYGVDISGANLAECARQIHSRNLTGFTPVLIPIESPEACLPHIERPADFFLSTAVYQHFPSKAYGGRVTRVASELVGPGGMALIQTRYDDGSPRFRPKTANYFDNVTTFTSYGVQEFLELASSVGFQPLHLKLVRATNYAYYFLRRR